MEQRLKKGMLKSEFEQLEPIDKLFVFLDNELYSKYKDFITEDDITSFTEHQWGMIIKFNPKMFPLFKTTCYATPKKIRKFLNIYPILKLYL